MVRKQTRFHFKDDAGERVFKKAMEWPREERTTVAEGLQKEFKKKYRKAPSIEILERKISKYRCHAEDGPLEQPWDMTTLTEYPLPPESLPAVIRAWYAMRSESAWTLSIRQARWVSRLYPFINDPLDLAHNAYICSANEFMSENNIGKPFPASFLNVFLYEQLSNEKVSPSLWDEILYPKKVPDALYNEIIHAKPVADLGIKSVSYTHLTLPTNREV